MTKSRQPQWLRILAEGAVIVVSILLAFGIDAWWQDRVEREIERSYLMALREDLDQSISLLQEYRAFQKRQVHYLEALLNAESSSANSQQIYRWIDDGLFKLGSYEPQLSTMRDLESSGQTRIIRAPAVRRALAAVMQRVESFQTLQADIQVSQQLLIDPFLVDNFDLSTVLPDGRRSADPNLSIVATDAFRSRVAFKLNLRNDVVDALDEVESAIAYALELVEIRLRHVS